MELWRRVGVIGPLVTHVEGYAAMLEGSGYADRTVDELVRLLAQLSRWLFDQGEEVGTLGTSLLERFLESRRSAARKTRSARAYAPLLRYLGGIGALPQSATPGVRSVTQTLLERYQRYLVRERGLLPTTVRAYAASAARFLCEQRDAGRDDLAVLTPGDITRTVLAECGRRKPGAARRWLVELRSVLRFLELDGRTRSGLRQAVPAISCWGGDSLPRAVTPDIVARLLASCDQTSRAGSRDFAIITLLARLGLRSLEAANLKLDDLDWRRGEIVVHAKGRSERLPQPSDVGEALSLYVQRRPRVACRSAFLTELAPIRGLGAAGVQSIVRRACRRSGLPTFGAHRLRHTAATQMLNAGASLAEVGQVLRHSDAQTTALYAKVDRASLRTLAPRWPVVR